MRLRRTCEENSAPQMYTILSSSLLLALFLFLPFFFALVLVRGVGAARMRSERGQMMRATLPGNSTDSALLWPGTGPVTSPACPCVTWSSVLTGVTPSFWVRPVKMTVSPTAYPPGSGGGGVLLRRRGPGPAAPRVGPGSGRPPS